MNRLREEAGIAAELAPSSAGNAAGEARRLLRQAESMQARRAAYDYFFHSPSAALPGVDLPVDPSKSRAAALPAWDSFNPLFSDREWRLYAVTDDPGGGGGGGGEGRAAEGCWGKGRGAREGRYGKDFREDESSGFGMFASRNGRSSPSFFSPPRRLLRCLKSREDESSGYGMFSSRKGRSSPSFFSPPRLHDSSVCAPRDSTVCAQRGTESSAKPASPAPRHSVCALRDSGVCAHHEAENSPNSLSSPPHDSVSTLYVVPAEPFFSSPPRGPSAGTASKVLSTTSPKGVSRDTSSFVSPVHHRSSSSLPLPVPEGQGRDEERSVGNATTESVDPLHQVSVLPQKLIPNRLYSFEVSKTARTFPDMTSPANPTPASEAAAPPGPASESAGCVYEPAALGSSPRLGAATAVGPFQPENKRTNAAAAAASATVNATAALPPDLHPRARARVQSCSSIADIPFQPFFSAGSTPVSGLIGLIPWSASCASDGAMAVEDASNCSNGSSSTRSGSGSGTGGGVIGAGLGRNGNEKRRGSSIQSSTARSSHLKSNNIDSGNSRSSSSRRTSGSSRNSSSSKCSRISKDNGESVSSRQDTSSRCSPREVLQRLWKGGGKGEQTERLHKDIGGKEKEREIERQESSAAGAKGDGMKGGGVEGREGFTWHGATDAQEALVGPPRRNRFRAISMIWMFKMKGL
ncbi:unnamed protein product [Closterium sp. NIES-53]